MSHQKPHVQQGLCQCDCRKCTVVTPEGDQVCICQDCDAWRCGLHDGVGLAPDPSRAV